jgi:multiple sugar transport system ATP-binding protein
MSEGRIEQLGTPDELYRKPATLTVARFIGTPSINLLPVEIAASGKVTAFARDLGLEAAGRDAGPATLGLRAEDLRPGAEGLAVRVVRSETHGADRFVSCRLLSDETVAITLRQGAGETLGADANGVMTLGFVPERAHLFAADGLRRKVTVREQVPA